ncbi:MAG: SGNH/GDSL hydrolase family protein [Verrucomicrobiia bacterium]
MRIRLLLVLIFVISGILANVHAQVRVLPLGDSITQGSSSYNTYRRPLWKMLIQAGYSVDFIGKTTLTASGTLPPNPDFDLDHEGHSGWRADELASQLPTWLASYTPDVVLLHVGSNDALQNHGGTSYLPMTVNDITQIISRLRADNPNVRVLLARIIGVAENLTWRGALAIDINARIDALNAQIMNIAATQSTAASPILVVDQHAGFQPQAGVDTYDGVHPNERGEAKMAEKWYQALQTILPRAQTFYRGINVGGSRTVVDGRTWDGQGAANYSSVGTPHTHSTVAFNPAVSSDRATMLRSFLYGTDVQLTLNSVPNGSYDVYVWTFEDNYPLTSNLSVEGRRVASHTSGPAGRWSRLGPFRADVADGNIAVRLQSTSSDQCIVSGLEVWQVGKVGISTSTPTAPPPPPTAPPPPPPSQPSGTFYRGINVGGGPVVIGGNRWEGQNAPNYSGPGPLLSFASLNFTPAVDLGTSEMLRNCVCGPNVQLTLSAVPNGTYDVYIWTIEDNNPVNVALSVEGAAVGNYTSGPAGKWGRLGPYRVSVADGNITAGWRILSPDWGQVCGLEVWRASTAPPPVGTFYRGINVGGSQTVVDGRTWDGQGAANYSSIGTPYTYSSMAFNPPVNSDRATMLRSFIYGADVQLTLNSVPNGTYDVYVWTFEDNYPLTASLSVEGSRVATYTSGPAGKWNRLGPFRANIADGNITVRFQTSLDLCLISGLEVWRY